jgi:hypothetical protein
LGDGHYRVAVRKGGFREIRIHRSYLRLAHWLGPAQF